MKENEVKENKNDENSDENLDNDAEIVEENEEENDPFNTPDLKYLKARENFLQKFLFIENWGLKGSKQRVIALDALVKYLKKTRSIADNYPSLSSEVVRDNLRLILLKQLPLPADQLDDAKLHDVAYDGDDDTHDEILKKLEAELVKQRRIALIYFTFAETHRVNCLDNYKYDGSASMVVEDESFDDKNVIKVPQKMKESKRPNVHNATSYLKKLHLEILAQVKSKKRLKTIMVKLRRCKRKHLEFSSTFDIKLKEWNSDMENTEAVVKKYQEELELKSLDKQETAQEPEAEEIKIHETLANLPEIPTELFNDASAWCEPSSNVDEEIEDRLLKLKFFNNVWLSNKKSLNPPAERPLTLKDIDFLDTNNPEESFKVDQNEPIETSNEERENFNIWYESKLNARSHSKVEKYPNSITTTPTPTVDSVPSSTSMVEMNRSRLPTDREVMFNTPTVWQVNMDVVFVVIITMFKILMPNLSRVSKYSPFPEPLTTPSPVPKPSPLNHSPSSVAVSVKQQTRITPECVPDPVPDQPADVTRTRSLHWANSWDLVKRWGSETIFSEILGLMN